MSDAIDFPGYGAAPAVLALPVNRFDASAGAWTGQPGTMQDVRAAALTCVTFNTWFQGGEAALRHRGLVDCLARCEPDIVMLQESTVALLQALLDSDWIRADYCCVRAPFRDDAIPSHGLMILSRFPILDARLHPLRTYMGRRLLVAQCRVNGSPLTLATVHLESMKRYGDVRADQLKSAFGVLEDAPEAVLAGDFNFCSSWPQENGAIDARFRDLWPLLRPGEPGYTQDTDVNVMLALAKREEKRVRFDRILLRQDAAAPRWTPQAIELLGTGPVDAAHPKVFPSDHFGLCARLTYAG